MNISRYIKKTSDRVNTKGKKGLEGSQRQNDTTI